MFFITPGFCFQTIRNIFLLSLIITGFAGVSNAQDTQPWGEVNASIFQNDNLTDDPDARAVILFDKAEVYYNVDGNLVMNRHTRIKILDPDGSDYTDFAINHARRGLSSLRAQTLNMNVSGQIEATQLRSSDFIETELPGNRRRTTFTYQQLEPGSVVEVQYTIRQGAFSYISPWYFQHSEPILYSELTRYTPEIIRFMQLTRSSAVQNTGNIFTQNIGSYPPGSNIFNDIFSGVGGNIERASARNLPAVREDSYISSVNNFRLQAMFQLYERYNPQQRRAERVLEDWQTWTASLVRDNDFGRQIERANRAIRNKVDELTDGLTSDLDKAEAMYDYIVNSVSWDGRIGIYSSEGVRSTFSENTGTGPDITLLYLAMLHEAGIISYPILLSTRERGLLYTDYPVVGQFNHMIAYAIIDGFEYLIEPLSPHLPFGTLRPSTLNGQGLLVDRRNPGWVELEPRMNESTRSLASVAIDEAGNLSGSLQLRKSGYEALDTRIALSQRATSSREYLLNEVLSSLPGAEITNYEINNLEDPKSPVDTEVEITRDGHAMIAGDMMYIEPFMVNRIDENPFTQVIRVAPVEFNYGREEVFNLNLTIPEGYEIEEVPESVQLMFTERTSYQQLVQPMGNSIQITVNFNIGDRTIHPDDYASLQEFYSEIVALQSSQIVLRKITDDADDIIEAGPQD
ncbi:MAG: DUF3857 and transglutaminase domain-containing protein [Balneolia bacterium]|nr:DUF3857 and transglutaminase domain-containing protein [Balneolia bacterium]